MEFIYLHNLSLKMILEKENNKLSKPTKIGCSHGSWLFPYFIHLWQYLQSSCPFVIRPKA
jgi:hypothetical protein